MHLKIEIATGNSAFDGEGFGPELAGILRGLANELEQCSREHAEDAAGGELPLIDSNGNRVGMARFEGSI